MLAYIASATRHDTYITYTLTRAVDGSDERAAILGVCGSPAERVKTSISCTTEITTYQANREHINQQHQKNYAKHRDEYNAKRRAQYHERRCDILLKQKQDRAPCPLCNLTFRRVYIPIHVSRRHPVQ